MADVEKLIPKIKKWEGGYSSHPADTDGGCTMRGITLTTFRRYYGRNKNCNDLKNITEDQWRHILKTGFWDKMRADEIENQSIAELCVQMCWGSGTVTAIKKIQRCLGTDADGIVGKKTLALLNGDNRAEIHAKLLEMRRLWFMNIVQNNPKKKVFLKGWLNRLETFVFEE